MATRSPYLLIVLPLALAACGGGGGSSAHTTLRSAVEHTLAQRSEKVALDGTVELSGQTMKLKGDGAFARRGGELHLSVDVPVIGNTTVDEVVVGKRSWVRSPLAGGNWVELSKVPKALGFDARVLVGVTPDTALRSLLRGQSDSLGDGHYRVKSNQTRGLTVTSAEAWVDEHNLVERIKLQIEANDTHTVLTIHYSDFGTPVSVSPPQ